MKNPMSRNIDLFAVVLLAALLGYAPSKIDFSHFQTTWNRADVRVRSINLESGFERRIQTLVQKVRSARGTHTSEAPVCIFAPER